MKMRSISTLLVFCAAIAGLVAPTTAAAAEKKTINICWGPWATNEAVTKVVQPIIEERFGHDVELTRGSIAVIYTGVASGDCDFFLGSWQPETQKSYIEKYGPDMIDMGMLYNGGRLGWAVPSYVPEDTVRTIGDLDQAEVAEKLNGRITGIDSGGGLMQNSEKAMSEYGLEERFDLMASSGPAMTAALDKAVDDEEWIVVTAWSPHWMFAAYDLRYLEDPKNRFGSEEQIRAVGRQGFFKEFPRVASFIDRVYMPLAHMEQVMLDAEKNGDVEQAAKEYLQNHQDRIDYWVTGELPSEQ